MKKVNACGAGIRLLREVVVVLVLSFTLPKKMDGKNPKNTKSLALVMKCLNTLPYCFKNLVMN